MCVKKVVKEESLKKSMCDLS